MDISIETSRTCSLRIPIKWCLKLQLMYSSGHFVLILILSFIYLNIHPSLNMILESPPCKWNPDKKKDIFFVLPLKKMYSLFAVIIICSFVYSTSQLIFTNLPCNCWKKKKSYFEWRWKGSLCNTPKKKKKFEV